MQIHDFIFKWMIMPRIELEICSCYEQTNINKISPVQQNQTHLKHQLLH